MKNMKIAKLFKLVRNLLLAIVAFTLVTTTPSPAGEITLKTIVPNNSGQAPYRYSANAGIYQDTISESTTQPITFCSTRPGEEWIAPKNGTILVTWYYAGFFCAVYPGPENFGDISFSTKANGAQGLLRTIRTVTHIPNRSYGDVFMPPIVDAFTVTKGTAYDFDLQYHTQNFANCQLNLNANSDGEPIIDIQYVQGEIEIPEE